MTDDWTPSTLSFDVDAPLASPVLDTTNEWNDRSGSDDGINVVPHHDNAITPYQPISPILQDMDSEALNGGGGGGGGGSGGSGGSGLGGTGMLDSYASMNGTSHLHMMEMQAANEHRQQHHQHHHHHLLHQQQSPSLNPLASPTLSFTQTPPLIPYDQSQYTLHPTFHQQQHLHRVNLPASANTMHQAAASSYYAGAPATPASPLPLSSHPIPPTINMNTLSMQMQYVPSSRNQHQQQQMMDNHQTSTLQMQHQTPHQLQHQSQSPSSAASSGYQPPRTAPMAMRTRPTPGASARAPPSHTTTTTRFVDLDVGVGMGVGIANVGQGRMSPDAGLLQDDSLGSSMSPSPNTYMRHQARMQQDREYSNNANGGLSSSPNASRSVGHTPPTGTNPITVKRMARSSSSQNFLGPTSRTSGIKIEPSLAPRSGTTSGQGSPKVSGLKRKTSSTNLIADFSPPRIGGERERDRDRDRSSNSSNAAAANSSTTTGAATSGSTKKGMGRKTKSDVSLLTTTERKQRRLQRKAELARVSRRRKKMNLAGMEERVKELQDLIARHENGESIAVPPSGRRGASGGRLLSPSTSLANLQLISPSSSSNSLVSLEGGRKRAKMDPATFRGGGARDRHDSAGGSEEEEDDSQQEDSEEDEDDDDPDQDEDEDEATPAPQSKSQRGKLGMGPSSSTPALNRMSSANSGGSPAMMSRQTSLEQATTGVQNMMSSSHSQASAVSASPTPPSDDSFDMRAFLPPAAFIPVLPTHGWLGKFTRPHLPTLHRHAQDTLRTLDASLRLDPFEKLLRWLVQQAALANGIVPPTSPPTSQSTQAAQAWFHLSQQLELTPQQIATLVGSYQVYQSLASSLESLRQRILRTSIEARQHVSRVDAFAAALDQCITEPSGARLAEWVHQNSEWVHDQLLTPTSVDAIPVTSPNLFSDAYNQNTYDTPMAFQTLPNLGPQQYQSPSMPPDDVFAAQQPHR